MTWAAPTPWSSGGPGCSATPGARAKGGNFVETMLAKGAAGEHLSVVDDEVFAPTATRDMAERILLLLERGSRRASTTWRTAAPARGTGSPAEIFELAGLDADLTPRPAGRAGRPAARRSSILLDTKSAERRLAPVRLWRRPWPGTSSTPASGGGGRADMRGGTRRPDVRASPVGSRGIPAALDRFRDLRRGALDPAGRARARGHRLLPQGVLGRQPGDEYKGVRLIYTPYLKNRELERLSHEPSSMRGLARRERRHRTTCSATPSAPMYWPLARRPA